MGRRTFFSDTLVKLNIMGKRQNSIISNKNGSSSIWKNGNWFEGQKIESFIFAMKHFLILIWMMIPLITCYGTKKNIL